MKLKQLQSHLEEVNVYEEPKILLEQYPTTPHIAGELHFCVKNFPVSVTP